MSRMGNQAENQRIAFLEYMRAGDLAHLPLAAQHYRWLRGNRVGWRNRQAHRQAADAPEPMPQPFYDDGSPVVY